MRLIAWFKRCAGTVLCLMGSSLLLGADPPASSATISASPQFAKLCLGAADASKAVLLVFDESKGTGTGYDTLRFIPLDFTATPKVLTGKEQISKDPEDGQNSKKMCFESSIAEFSKAAGLTIGGEKPVVVVAGVEIRSDSRPKSADDTLTQVPTKQSPEKAAQGADRPLPRYLVAIGHFTLWAKDGQGTWECKFKQPLDLAATPADAVPLNPTAKLQLKVFAEIEGDELNIAAIVGQLDKKAGNNMITSIRNNGKLIELRMTVKNAAGKTVYAQAKPIDFFLPAVGPELALRSNAHLKLPERGIIPSRPL